MKQTFAQVIDWNTKVKDLLDFYRPNRKIVEEAAMIVDGDNKTLVLNITYKEQKNEYFNRN